MKADKWSGGAGSPRDVATIARVSIVHWNRPEECLATVAAFQSASINLAIEVVDNHSTDEAFARLRDSLPEGVVLSRLPENVGWGSAHNVVLERWLEDGAEAFCFVSAHDALPEPGCLEALLDAMRAHPSWGMACPEYGKGELPVYGLLRGPRVVPHERGHAGQVTEVEHAFGTLIVLRRESVAQAGAYDRGYFAYGDEVEICLRFRRQGWQIGLVWGAVVHNPGTWVSSPVVGYLWARNAPRIARSTHGVAGMIARLLVILISTARDTLRRAPAGSQASPRARWLGVRDFFRGYRGAPPSEVISLN
jgi:GT2 family glycosyltransferase